MELHVKLVERKEDPIGGIATLRFSVESPEEGALSMEVPLGLARRLSEGYEGEALLTEKKPASSERDLLMSAVVYQSDANSLRASAYGLLVILELKGQVADLAKLSRGAEVYLLLRDIVAASP